MKPFIGVTTNFSVDETIGSMTKLGAKGQTWHLLASDYIEVVERAGGIPVIIPLLEDFDDIKTLVDKVDGVIFSGGNDISPHHYNLPFAEGVGELCSQRDKQEIRLMDYMIESTTKPILGICRGCQLLNVALGGTIHPDLSQSGLNDHLFLESPKNNDVHSIDLVHNSNLFNIFKRDTIRVNSYHHQAIDVLADGLISSAQSEDGLIEAVELKQSGRFVLGVQWHPEMMSYNEDQNKIFEKFVVTCL